MEIIPTFSMSISKVKLTHLYFNTPSRLYLCTLKFRNHHCRHQEAPLAVPMFLPRSTKTQFLLSLPLDTSWNKHSRTLCNPYCPPRAGGKGPYLMDDTGQV